MAHSKYLRVPQYEAGPYPKNRLDKVQTLFSQAFGGRTISEESLRWQMEGNPCLKERAVSLWENDTLVAYSALTPFRAVLRGEEIIAAVSGTTMADENHPGSSVQLTETAAENNRDISLLFGFPNHNAFRIDAKYTKYRYVGDIAFWTATAGPADVSPRIREFSAFSGEYGPISRELSKDHDFIKIRDKNFLNWRFFQRPGFDYRGFEYGKRGYLIADTYPENGAKQLQIVDILADSEEVMDELLKYAVNLGFEQGCGTVKLWLTSKRYESVLKRSGFVYGERPFAMVVWDRDLDIAKSYITMGDSDIF